jgi:hypothetical protein
MAARLPPVALAAALFLAPAAARAQDAPMDPYGDKAKPAAPKKEPAAPAPARPAPPPSDQPVDPYADQPVEAPPPPVDPADDIDDQVAEALYARGQQLLSRGDAADAKQLFIESLERSPKGSRSSDAIRYLRVANKKLGLPRDDGRPGAPATPPAIEQPMDPYGGGGGGGGGQGVAEDRDQLGPSQAGRRIVMAWSAAAGLIAGLAVAGPTSETTNELGETSTEVSGGAVLAGLVGAGAGFAGSWWLTDRYPVTTGQSIAIASGGTWGVTELALFGDAVTGTDSDGNDVWKFAAVGGLAGLGAGTWYAAEFAPTEDEMMFVNSLGAIGAGGGLLVGVGIQPPETEAYSINALVGSLGGLGVGLALSDSVQVSSRRMLYIDLASAAGAAIPWLLLYPLIKDGESENDEQAAGWLSALTLGGGAIAGWYFTRGLDDDGAEAQAARDAAPPALVTRDGTGRWGVGLPLPRLMSATPHSPSRTALGADLLSGRF